MDLNEIKKIVPGNGERYIFIENGKPVLVLLSFEDYQKRFNSKEGKETEREKTLPLIPQRTSQVKNELTLEDLPF